MARPTRPEPKVFLEDLGPGQDRDWYVAHLVPLTPRPGRCSARRARATSTGPTPSSASARVLGDAAHRGPARDPVARAVSTGGSAPRAAWRTAAGGGSVDQPRRAAAVGSERDLGVAVRLSRARSIRVCAAAVAGRLRRPGPRPVPRGAPGGPGGHRRRRDTPRHRPRARRRGGPGPGQHQSVPTRSPASTRRSRPLCESTSRRATSSSSPWSGDELPWATARPLDTRKE